ncbi:hypothetical protein WDW89_12240 [Deltaproteobacteria bacterium TL4]
MWKPKCEVQITIKGFSLFLGILLFFKPLPSWALETLQTGGDSIIQWEIVSESKEFQNQKSEVILTNHSDQRIKIVAFSIIENQNVDSRYVGLRKGGYDLEPQQSMSYLVVPLNAEKPYQYQFYYGYMTSKDQNGVGEGFYPMPEKVIKKVDPLLQPSSTLVVSASEASAPLRRIRDLAVTQELIVFTEYEACAPVVKQAQQSHCNPVNENLIKKTLSECYCGQNSAKSWSCTVRYIDYCEHKEKSDYYVVSEIVTLNHSPYQTQEETCDYIKWEAKLSRCKAGNEILIDQSLDSCRCAQLPPSGAWTCFVPFQQVCQKQLDLTQDPFAKSDASSDTPSSKPMKTESTSEPDSTTPKVEGS